jgi:lipoprotein-anchoring transpeptidase ErfK/SrfK
MEGRRVSGQGFGLGSGRLWCLAILAATGMFGVSSRTEAAIYYWEDSAPAAETAPAPKSSTRRAKTQRHGDKKSAIVEKREAKPQGPLIISVSIAQQRLRIYDANGLFAESPISTGMPGHSTPMGVFSVIQKQKFHQSNIYSGAPMPFMQRITWSGIALHAGVLPGHPASHGCIRMPMAFAVKMYGWTRMGARVIVTPGEVTPASFSHPLLASVKVVPQPVAAQETKADAAIELRPTVGHAADMKAANETAKLKTADASGAMLAIRATTGVSETPPANRPAQTVAIASDKVETSKTAAQKNGAEANAPKAESDPAAAKNDNTASSEAKPANDSSVEARPSKAADGDIRPAGAVEAQPAKLETATETARPADNKSDGNKPADNAAAPADPIKAATTPAMTDEMPLKEDLKSDFAKTYLYPTLKKNEQLAVFVSRKDSKLYVRQNFAPLFDVPVTIAVDQRPLGTHIFTAQVDKSDANVLHWSVVSLPAPAKAAGRRASDEGRLSHGRKFASPAPIEAKVGPLPNSPAEALDRLNLPAEVMTKIYEAVSTGGSIIVSDQGIAGGETGEGTDFIVSLR